MPCCWIGWRKCRQPCSRATAILVHKYTVHMSTAPPSVGHTMQITAFAFCNVRCKAEKWIHSPATLSDTPWSQVGPPVTFGTVLTFCGTDSTRCWISQRFLRLNGTLDQNHWDLLLAVSCYGLLLLKVPFVVCSEKALVLLLPSYHLKPVYPFSSDLPSMQPPPAGYFLFFRPFSVNSRDDFK